VSGFDSKFDEFKSLFRETRKDDYGNLHTDISKNKCEGKIVIVTKKDLKLVFSAYLKQILFKDHI